MDETFELDANAMTSLMANGYLHLPSLLPGALVDDALTAINRNLIEEGLDPDQFIRYESSSFCPELRASPVIQALIRDSPVWGVVEQLLGHGRVEFPQRVQIALRFPEGDGNRTRDTFAVPHVDGFPHPLNEIPAGTVKSYSLLACMHLSDVLVPNAGNFTVWPGTHRHNSEYFRGHGAEAFDGGRSRTDGSWRQQLLARRGDVTIMHYLLGHHPAPNLSPNIRYTVFFRISVKNLKERWLSAITDHWSEWHGVHQLLDTVGPPATDGADSESVEASADAAVRRRTLDIRASGELDVSRLSSVLGCLLATGTGRPEIIETDLRHIPESVRAAAAHNHLDAVPATVLPQTAQLMVARTTDRNWAMRLSGPMHTCEAPSWPESLRRSYRDASASSARITHAAPPFSVDAPDTPAVHRWASLMSNDEVEALLRLGADPHGSLIASVTVATRIAANSHPDLADAEVAAGVGPVDTRLGDPLRDETPAEDAVRRIESNLQAPQEKQPLAGAGAPMIAVMADLDTAPQPVRIPLDESTELTITRVEPEPEPDIVLQVALRRHSETSWLLTVSGQEQRGIGGIAKMGEDIGVTLRHISQAPITPLSQLRRRLGHRLAKPGKTRKAADPVTEVWSELVEHQAIDEDKWFDSGGTIMRAHRMCERIEEILGRRPPVAALLSYPTLGAFRHFVQDRPQLPEVRRRFADLTGDPGGPQVVYVPGAFGEDFHCRRFLVELGWPVRWLRADGLDEGTPPASTSIEGLAQGYLDLLPPDAERPLLVLGYSMGGCVAWVMAEELRQQGRAVIGVVLLDTLPPGHIVTPGLTAQEIYTEELRTVVEQISRRPVAAALSTPSVTGPAEHIATYLHHTNVLPPGLGYERFSRRLWVYAHSAAAAQEFRRPRYDERLLHVASREAADVSWPAPISRVDVPSSHKMLFSGNGLAQSVREWVQAR